MYPYIKRSMDVVFSICGLIVLLPLLAIVGIMIIIDSPGPVFYRQTRVGLKGNNFQIIKFRSMRNNSDSEGWSTGFGDQRITRVGSFLRKTSIDELPQLINVLKGDMSLVGPRPDVPQQAAWYDEEAWKKRHAVRPGISGLSQVKGRSLLTSEERLAWDLYYVNHVSFFLDIKILWKTIYQILRRRNAW